MDEIDFVHYTKGDIKDMLTNNTTGLINLCQQAHQAVLENKLKLHQAYDFTHMVLTEIFSASSV